MLFFSTTAHKRSSQQWSYKQNFLLLRYSAHLSLDVHCSSHLKKNKIFLLTSLSPHIKKTISYPLSLSGFFFFLLSSSKIFFSLKLTVTGQLPQPSARRPTFIADLFRQPARWPAPSSLIADLFSSPANSLFFLLSLSTTPPASTSPAQASTGLNVTDPSLFSPLFLVDLWLSFFFFFFFIWFGGCGDGGWFWLQWWWMILALAVGFGYFGFGSNFFLGFVFFFFFFFYVVLWLTKESGGYGRWWWLWVWLMQRCLWFFCGKCEILFYCKEYIILLWCVYYFIVLKGKIDSLLQHGCR